MAGGTKTGIGGFEINGKIHDFDLGDPNAPGDPESSLPAPDTGDIHVDNSTKDVSKGTRTTLSQYLKGITTNNEFPIDGTPHDVATTDEHGVPTPFTDDPVNVPQFTKRSAASGVTTDTTGDPATTLGLLSKGKHFPHGVNGNQLLPGVSQNSLPEPIKTYTSTVLANNRFTDASLAASEVTGNANDVKPPNDFNPSLQHPRYGNVSLKRLAQVGTALSLRASQELNAATPNNNPTGGGQEAAALLPGFNQLGATRIRTTVLEAADVFASLTSAEVPDGDYTNIADQSWGALNNVDDPWSGIEALGMIALSTALTAAIILLYELLALLFGLIKGSTGSDRLASGRYVLGRHSVSKGADPSAFPPNFPPDIGALLGLQTTTFPFRKCVQTGTLVFFGIDFNGDAGAVALSALNSVTQAPGFNSIVARTIIRSSAAVIDAFKKAFSSPNVVAGIKNVLNIIDVLRTSKLIAAANVFAMIGDQTLSDPGDIVLPADKVPEEPPKKSRMDSYGDDIPFAAVQKSRLRGAQGQGSLKLAWSSNRAPAMYLIPDSILTMGVVDNTLGGFKGAAGLTNPDGLSQTFAKVLKAEDAVTNGSRIPRNSGDQTDPFQVKLFEAKLDAEYVPFSFHDLRTNEIISFHAFLAALNDDYTANYETIDGYGRVDPVKIYKSTSRRIGMSFYVLATSESDFDDMWMKLNKLITLVYPQYTRGHMLTNADQGLQFVQPFSQLIGASPLIRIRLGDLIRSNYSRFALARLFGLGGPDTIKLGTDGQIDPFKDAESKLQKIKDALAKPTGDLVFNMTADGWKQAGGGTNVTVPVSGNDTPTQAPVLKFDLSDAPYIMVTTSDVGQDNMAKAKVRLATAEELTKILGADTKVIFNLLKGLSAKYDNPKDVSNRIIGSAPYKIPLAFLKPTQQTLEKLFKDQFGSDSANIDKMSAFLDINKNALARSFNSIQGKGLAGVIETMGFDWYDKVTWETKPGSTAPKLCKVTIAFAPIHDISPGIDHMGYNRGPVYPVGSAMRNGNDPEGTTR